MYESERAVHEYLQFHYDATILRGPSATPDAPSSALQFAQRVAQKCAQHAKPDRKRSALDVGCAVGGSSFELSKDFAAVAGFDFSHTFAATCVELQQKGEKAYEALVSGEVMEKCVAKVPRGSLPERCVFSQGDACDLQACALVGGKTFDCVLAANLLCRLPDPERFLRAQAGLINSE